MMHPLEKILLLMTACQLLQTGYLVWHAFEIHGAAQRRIYFLRISPLIAVTVFLAVLVLRLLHLMPYVGI